MPPGAGAADRHETIHGSCVACAGGGVLIVGPSGSGKSGLALELMARGARLVADDGVLLTRQGNALVAQAPAAIAGRIEARFVGVLAADAAGPVPLKLVVEMGQVETERLPPRRSRNIMGVALPLLHNVDSGHFPAAILQYLKAGRCD